MQSVMSILVSAAAGALFVGCIVTYVALIWERRVKRRQEEAVLIAITRMEDTHTMLRWEREFNQETIRRLQGALRDVVGYEGELDGVPGIETVAAARTAIQNGKGRLLEAVVGPDHVRALSDSIPLPMNTEIDRHLRALATMGESRKQLAEHKASRPRGSARHQPA